MIRHKNPTQFPYQIQVLPGNLALFTMDVRAPGNRRYETRGPVPLANVHALAHAFALSMGGVAVPTSAYSEPTGLPGRRAPRTLRSGQVQATRTAQAFQSLGYAVSPTDIESGATRAEIRLFQQDWNNALRTRRLPTVVVDGDLVEDGRSTASTIAAVQWAADRFSPQQWRAAVQHIGKSASPYWPPTGENWERAKAHVNACANRRTAPFSDYTAALQMLNDLLQRGIAATIQGKPPPYYPWVAPYRVIYCPPT